MKNRIGILLGRLSNAPKGRLQYFPKNWIKEFPIAYSIAGKIEGIDSVVGITIISIAVYGTFIGAPASLGYIANNYGINNIFIPMLIVFIILLLPISIYRKKFLI